jgi:hypothetical protein
VGDSGNVAARPALAGLRIGDPPEAWEEFGFLVRDGGMDLGGVRVTLGGRGDGITSWSIHGIRPAPIDGLAFGALPAGSDAGPDAANGGRAHPNGAIGIDHVVVLTPDFDRTVTALEANGITLSRVRDAGGFRQGFRRLGPAILELVEARSAPGRPARFWGLVVTVEDLDALAEQLGDRLGAPKPAVQPGRRIATVRDGCGLSPKVAFMTPEAGPTEAV